MGERITGRISKLITGKGFGFIKDGRGQEYFFQRDSLSSINTGVFESLTEQQQVNFEATKGPKGLRAEDVRLG